MVCPLNPIFFWCEGMRGTEQAGSLPLTLAGFCQEVGGRGRLFNNRIRATCGRERERCSQVGERRPICGPFAQSPGQMYTDCSGPWERPRQKRRPVGECERGVPTTPNPSEGLQLCTVSIQTTTRHVPTTPNPSEGLQLRIEADDPATNEFVPTTPNPSEGLQHGGGGRDD